MTRACRACGTERLLDEFGLYTTQAGTLLHRRTCNPCRRSIQAERYRSEPEVAAKMKANARRCFLKNSYGMSEGEFAQLFLRQRGRCGICMKKITKRLNVDHCHATGRVRGLLCWGCNVGLGHFKDSAANLARAMNYLRGII